MKVAVCLKHAADPTSAEYDVHTEVLLQPDWLLGPVDFIALAHSMGVDATLVEKAGDVGDAMHAALATGRPHLLELPISSG